MKITPVQKIKLPPWISQEAIEILCVLGGDLNIPKSFFVGGCVRNSLLNEIPTDIDIATQFTPDNVIEILNKNKIKTIPTGIKHGTVTAVKNNIHVEITTYRNDVITDGRHAQIQFSNNILEDAKRRDFTINSLYMDAVGEIYDPLNQGLKDLEQRKIRFVGEASHRIKEDYLRILRFFRFEAQYGVSDIDAKTVKACSDNKEGLYQLSRERISQEFLKILNTDRAPKILNIMFEVDILSAIKAKDYNPNNLKRLIQLQSKYTTNDEEKFSAMVRYFIVSGGRAVFHDKILNFSNKQIKFLIKLETISNKNFYKTEELVKKLMLNYDRQATLHGYIVLMAQEKINFCDDIYKIITEWTIPVCPTTGEDLLKEGYETGPELGQELQRRKEEWFEEIL